MTERWKDGWEGKDFLKALSCSSSNGSFIPTMLSPSSFPVSALTPPSGVVSTSSAGPRVTPPGVSHSPHFLGVTLSESLHVPALTSVSSSEMEGMGGCRGTQHGAQSRHTAP